LSGGEDRERTYFFADRGKETPSRAEGLSFADGLECGVRTLAGLRSNLSLTYRGGTVPTLPVKIIASADERRARFWRYRSPA